MAVAGPAPDAGAGPRIPLVQHDPERHVEGPQSLAGEVVGQVLDAWLVADRRVRIGRARRRIGGIDSALAVDVIEPLGPRVVGLEILVGDRPRRRYPAPVLDLAEVLAAEPEEGG